jgi:hypothetical protein
MRLQCSCGARYDFDVTPEMAAASAQFVCPACGADDSAMLNELIQRQVAAGASQPISEFCLKHGLETTHRCLVCQKPICPKCMEVFGYVCSVRCTETADRAGVDLPVYKGHIAVVRARARRKAWRIGLSAATALVLALGVWSWYQFIGSRPRVAWSVKFPEPAYDGETKLIPPNDALILRGDHLIRYDLAAKKERWSVKIAERKKAGDGWAAPPLRWQVQGQDVWLASGDKVIRYDGRTGEVAQEIPVGGDIQLFSAGASAIAVVARGGAGRQISARIDLGSGEVQREEITLPTMKKPERPTTTAGRAPPANPQLGSGPAAIKAARAVQLLANRPLPPETEEEEREQRTDDPIDRSRGEIIGGHGGLVQVSVNLIEKKTAIVQAMKAPPAKSALEGDVSAASSISVVNETLNEWQRERTGGIEHEDVSRYQVTLKRLLQPGTAQWSGEVVGPPDLFPLPSVNVLIAGKGLLVFDKTNKKLWESKLAYGVSVHFNWGEGSILNEEAELASPCIEHDGTLFIVDLGMVTAFDLISGNVRWRLPSVGISGLFFDDRGMAYLNTTDAGQERLKFSQQIDIESKTRQLILKVDPQSGKVLWRVRNRGRLARATGKFLYSVEWAGGEDGAHVSADSIPAHLRIYRLDPQTGDVVWEHYQPREPLALDFDHNTIQALFKKEMQVLKFVSF